MTSIPAGRAEVAPRYNGLVYDLPERIYHQQPELSSTGARTLLSDSPARFKWRMEHPITGAALDLGTVTHALVLGTPNPAKVIEGGRGKAEREREARAEGLIPVLAEDYALVKGMADAVLMHEGARRILEADGKPEVSVFAEDPETGVRVRARFDWLGTKAADLKTTAGSASASGFGLSAAKFNYPVQQVWYEDALAWATGGVPVGMAFIVVEKARPHFVGVHEFDDTVRLIAAEQAAKARRIYAECMATDTWPAHGDDVIHTELPNWWFSQNEEEEEIVV